MSISKFFAKVRKIFEIESIVLLKISFCFGLKHLTLHSNLSPFYI